MSAAASLANFQAALSLLNHSYFDPIIGALVRSLLRTSRSEPESMRWR